MEEPIKMATDCVCCNQETNECDALTEFCCALGQKCKFKKTAMDKLIADRMVEERLSRLPIEKQREISEKYYGGEKTFTSKIFDVGFNPSMKFDDIFAEGAEDGDK